MIRKSKAERKTSQCLNVDPPQNIYCSEHLTKNTKRILYHIKSLAKEGLVKYVWINEGVVHYREDDNSRAVKVANEVEMEQVLESFERSRRINDGMESDESSSQKAQSEGEQENTQTPAKKWSAAERSPQNSAMLRTKKKLVQLSNQYANPSQGYAHLPTRQPTLKSYNIGRGLY